MKKPAQVSVRVQRSIAADRKRVFDAWSSPDSVRQWFAPGPMSVTEAKMDFKVGGAFRIVMTDPEGGPPHVATGTYREIKRPGLLSFTWSWEADPSHFESLVTVEFHVRGRHTEVVLRHELLRSQAEMTEHEEGWAACLDNFAKFVSSQ